jgi:hypothetical protein
VGIRFYQPCEQLRGIVARIYAHETGCSAAFRGPGGASVSPLVSRLAGRTFQEVRFVADISSIRNFFGVSQARSAKSDASP